MDKKLLLLKRKLYRQLAHGEIKKASSTRRELLGMECALHESGFRFGPEHIVT